MAVSGSQKTRIGAAISGIGIKLTITAKAAGVESVIYCALTAKVEGDYIAIVEADYNAIKENDMTAELERDYFSRICP